jgi:LCP family protein required for cell wall assembly
VSHRPRRLRRSWGQRLLLTFNGFLILGLVATAAGLGYGYVRYRDLPRIQVGGVLSDAPEASGAQNFLLVGVDSAAKLESDDPALAGRDSVGGLRSDTMMILRVDPQAKTARLLSLPRDLWVPLARGGHQRLNTAIQLGGPDELIDTIQQYFGIAINHYVQVDFAGFQDVVEAIDGVPLYLPYRIRDPKSFLQVDETGCVTLGPSDALAYVRSRHFQYYDAEQGRWRSDGSSDFGRVRRQQDFIIRAMKRAIAKGARNPVTLDHLIDAGLKTVTVDDLLTANDLVLLANAFRDFEPGELAMHTLPVTGDNIGGASVLRLIDDDAQATLDLFREQETVDASTPSAIRVQVLNGSGRTGEARSGAEGLTAAGFASAGTGEAGEFDHPRTLVRYHAGSEAAADLVARYLTAGAALEVTTDALDADVVVVTGQDFAGVRTDPAPATSSSSTTTTVPSTVTSVVSSSTTSTSAAGVLPTAPPGVSC